MLYHRAMKRRLKVPTAIAFTVVLSGAAVVGIAGLAGVTGCSDDEGCERAACIEDGTDAGVCPSDPVVCADDTGACPAGCRPIG